MPKPKTLPELIGQAESIIEAYIAMPEITPFRKERAQKWLEEVELFFLESPNIERHPLEKAGQ